MKHLSIPLILLVSLATSLTVAGKWRSGGSRKQNIGSSWSSRSIPKPSSFSPVYTAPARSSLGWNVPNYKSINSRYMTKQQLQSQGIKPWHHQNSQGYLSNGYGYGYGSGHGTLSNGYNQKISNIGSTLLTAGLFYGIGRGSSQNHYHYYDQKSRLEGTTPVSSIPTQVQIISPTPETNQTVSLEQNVISTMNGMITINETNSLLPVEEVPKFDLNKTELYVAEIVSIDEVDTGRNESFPLLLNESIVELPVYAFNYPNWTESEMVTPLNFSEIQNPAENVEEGFTAKLGNILLRIGSFFGIGRKTESRQTETTTTTNTVEEKDLNITLPLISFDENSNVTKVESFVNQTVNV